MQRETFRNFLTSATLGYFFNRRVADELQEKTSKNIFAILCASAVKKKRLLLLHVQTRKLHAAIIVEP